MRSIRSSSPRTGLARVRAWFGERGWRPLEFQEKAWAEFRSGRSGLIHVPTGAGKTYAAFGGPMASLIDDPPDRLAVVYLTPLRAMSRDADRALAAMSSGLAPGLLVGSLTGDTSAALRARQKVRPPHVLITTPESLTLLLSREDAPQRFSGVRAIIVDEWHELLSTKRGSQTELALARLRRWSPGVLTWAISATIPNVSEAARAAAGVDSPPPAIVSADPDRPIIVDTLIPSDPRRLPHAGHLGLPMVDEVAELLDPARSTLIFTNTRSQAERWFQGLTRARPEWAHRMALHHGSIDRGERERVEAGLRTGEIPLVVCTSSLDLGVDFGPVELVLQVGSPKGVARLIQRAGRSGHRPGSPCRVVCVPCQAMELVEACAARAAISAGGVEPRRPLDRPLDVLVQHLVTCAMGGGFRADDLYAEVRTAAGFAGLTEDEFGWAMDLVRRGGGALAAYEDFHRVLEVDGVYRVASERIGRLHRANIGTITAEEVVPIRFVSGRWIGSIEEDFLGRLRPGTRFVFAGRALEFVGVRNGAATVRQARGRPTLTPIWGGTRLPMTEALGAAVRDHLERAAALIEAGADPAGDGPVRERRGSTRPPDPTTDREFAAALHFLRIQARVSAVPRGGEILLELATAADGRHLFMYPFEGRQVHAGLAALFAYRIGKREPSTLAVSANDYGLELLGPAGFDFRPHLTPELFGDEGLIDDVAASVNLSELSRRRFREVARVSGLVHRGLGSRASGSTDSGLLYDVLEQFDPGNRLIDQARREVVEQHFERGRLARSLARIRAARPRVVAVDSLSPLSLPMVAERLSSAGRISTESLAERVDRIVSAWAGDRGTAAGAAADLLSESSGVPAGRRRGGTAVRPVAEVVLRRGPAKGRPGGRPSRRAAGDAR